MKTIRLGIAAVLVALCAGCDLFAPDDEHQRFMGFIGFDVHNVGLEVIQAADTVDAGVSFDVTVTTETGTGCYETAGYDLVLESNVAEITPYDRRTGTACPDPAAYHPRVVTLTFDEPGTGLVRVIGVSWDYDEETDTQSTVLTQRERTVTVR